jgi:hypothetical protein
MHHNPHIFIENMHHQIVNNARFSSFSRRVDRCSHRPLWRTGQSDGTTDSLVWPSDCCDFLAVAEFFWRFLTFSPFLTLVVKSTVGATDLVAHRTVWCNLPTVGEVHMLPADRAAICCLGHDWLTGQSGVHQTVRWIIVAVRWIFLESGLFVGAPAWAPDTVRWTPDSLVHHRLVQV